MTVYVTPTELRLSNREGASAQRRRVPRTLNRAAVAVCGDGGFGIAMNGLLTAIEERIPIVVVVFDNAMLGWVRHGQGERPIASKFADFDYAAIARAMGCFAVRVEHPGQLAPALQQALDAGIPAVVDVVTSSRITFRDVTASLPVKRLAMTAS